MHNFDKKKPLLSDSLATGDNKGFVSANADQHRDRITRFATLKHRANYDGDINGFSLEFRKDGTYKFCNYSVLGGKYFRGKYLLKDSIITLDRNNIDDVIKSNQLAIRKISENYKGREYKIVQINKNHQRIENEYFDFVITIDKRNK